jgi:hypothetical protein
MLQIIQPQKYSYGMAYPAGATPGFDPTHIAAGGIVRFSGVGMNGSFLNILSGKPGTLAGGANGKNGLLGPVVRSDVATEVCTFPGQNTVLENTGTYAAIFVFNGTVAANSLIFSTSNGLNTGFQIGASSRRPFIQMPGNSTTSFSTLPLLVANTPYFFAASTSSAAPANANGVLINLSTGSITTQSAAVSTPGLGPTDGNYVIGASASQSGSIGIGLVAAAMCTNKYIGMAQLTIWAIDPWSFWYPQK